MYICVCVFVFQIWQNIRKTLIRVNEALEYDLRDLQMNSDWHSVGVIFQLSNFVIEHSRNVGLNNIEKVKLDMQLDGLTTSKTHRYVELIWESEQRTEVFSRLFEQNTLLSHKILVVA